MNKKSVSAQSEIDTFSIFLFDQTFDKYSFSLITDNNLEVLLNKKDLLQYKKFLEQNLPGKF